MQKRNFRFDDETIQELFGVDDAENEKAERLKAFFFKNKAYENLKNKLPVRVVVGHKGIGKSALLKMCYLEDQEEEKPAIWTKPEQFLGVASNIDFNEMINAWKASLRKLVYEHFLGKEDTGLPKSFGSAIITDLLEASKDKLGANNTANLLLKHLHQKKRVTIYIDDLDRGWKATPDDVRRVSALLNAVRDLSGEEGIRFIIALRTDVYHLVRTSDESTDKIEQNIINLEWTNHEILFVMASRIELFLTGSITAKVEMNQRQLFNSFDKIIEPRFKGRGKWEDVPMHRVLLSLTRKRPRDLIKLLSSAAKEAYRNNSNLINSQHLQSVFNNYSQERLQDLINEFQSELPLVRNLLFGMKPTKKGRTTRDAFLYDKGTLTSKMREIKGQNTFYFANKKQATESSLAEFLYRIDFIIARKEVKQANQKVEIERVYFEKNKNLMGREDFGYHWEVHPAYRWALEPSDPQSIFDNVDI